MVWKLELYKTEALDRVVREPQRIDGVMGELKEKSQRRVEEKEPETEGSVEESLRDKREIKTEEKGTP